MRCNAIRIHPGIPIWVKWIAFVLALASILVVANGQSSSSITSSSTRITATVRPQIILTVQDDALVWDLSPSLVGTYTKNNTINIKSNANWELIVKDPDTGSDGSMREWNGVRYGARELHIPLKVSADNEVTFPNSEGKSIKEGKQTDAKGDDVRLTMIQEVINDDFDISQKSQNISYRKAISIICITNM